MSLARFVENVLDRVRETPVNMAQIAPDAVRGALFAGAAGVAFFLHEAARLRKDEALLDRAREWCDAATEWARHASHDDWRGRPRGFVIGETGIAYVDALISARLGDAGRVALSIDRIARVSERFDDLRAGVRPTELVSGAAGVVCATQDLDARLPRGPEHEATREQLARIRDRVAAPLVEIYAKPLRVAPGSRLGMAHGIAGELWALVALLGPEHGVVRARLSDLATLREVDPGGLKYWVSATGAEVDGMIGSWCAGMTGHLILWCGVAERSKATEARELARESAETTAVLASANPTICCGAAGQSLALERYAALSGDARFSKRAYARLASATKMYGVGGEPIDLGFYQGALGVAFVAMARRAGERRFPCIETLGEA